MHHVVILALPDVVAFDLAVPAQVFGHPDEHARYLATVCTPVPGLVPTTTGFAIAVSAGLEALDTADSVVIPGYVPHVAPAAAVIEALRAASGRGARMISVCTGAFALAATGLLDGRRAATHWRDAAELAARYPAIHVDADTLYVSEEPVLTSAGIAAGIDLCMHVVRLDYGEQIAAEVARRMVVAPHRTGGQAQFLHRPVPATGTGLAPTCEWALAHLAEPLSVAGLARHAGWAPRTFARRFLAETGTTPQRWITAQRLLRARHLLETSDLPIEQIADRAGLGSAANLRLLLNRDTGTSPSSYRRSYRGNQRILRAGAHDVSVVPELQAFSGEEGAHGCGRAAERQLTHQSVVDLGLVREALPPDLRHLVPRRVPDGLGRQDRTAPDRALTRGARNPGWHPKPPPPRRGPGSPARPPRRGP